MRGMSIYWVQAIALNNLQTLAGHMPSLRKESVGGIMRRCIFACRLSLLASVACMVAVYLNDWDLTRSIVLIELILAVVNGVYFAYWLFQIIDNKVDDL